MINKELIFDEIATQLKWAVGYQLLTITSICTDRMQTERIYSTNPHEYPIRAIKSLYNDAWTVRVVYRAQAYFASCEEEMIAYFPDYLIARGLGSVINIPIVIEDVVIATVNMLHIEYFYNKYHIERLAPFAEKMAQITNLFDH